MKRLRWSSLPLRTKGVLVALIPAIPILFLWLLIAIVLMRPAQPPNAAARDRDARAALDRLAVRFSPRDAGATTADLSTLSKSIDDEAGRALVNDLGAIVARDPESPQFMAAVETLRSQRAARLAASTVVAQRRSRIFFWAFLGGSLLTVGGGIWIAARLVTNMARRMERVVEAADRLARGESVAAPAVGADEVGRLGQRLYEIMLLLQRREQMLADRNLDLANANRELESFSYSVSHDLRAPLRAIAGFSQVIEEDYRDRLDEPGVDALNRVRAATARMSELIDQLLDLSRLSRLPLHDTAVNISEIAGKAVDRLREAEPDRAVAVSIDPDVWVRADPKLIGIAVDNLLNNAWKYTRRTPEARIAVKAKQSDDHTVVTIEDNGAGFDMAHANMLFGPFQRLHSAKEFEGHGIGLATVQRIVHRHGGQIRGEGVVGRGAAFELTLRSAGAQVV
jgi:signal transduction histidine kinase